MLVSNTTARIDTENQIVRELITSCHEAQKRFRSAAAASIDGNLKRLFQIYAEQRNRFAEELRGHLHCELDHRDDSSPEFECDSAGSCLEADFRTLQLYKRALASRDLPTRTHFLVSSQLALMERAHDRVSALLARPVPLVPSIKSNAGRIRA